jgi:hypothetical protein
VVEVEVVESDRMRAPVGGHKGRAGGKDENDERCCRRLDGPAQELIKVEASGVQAGMRDVVTLPTLSRPVCSVLAATSESDPLHKTGPSAPSCG